jgi:hypothetical protein
MLKVKKKKKKKQNINIKDCTRNFLGIIKYIRLNIEL